MQIFKSKHMKHIRVVLVSCFSLISTVLQAAPEYQGPGRYANIGYNNIAHQRTPHHYAHKGHHKHPHKHQKKAQKHLNSRSDNRVIDRAEVIYVEPIKTLVRVSDPQTQCWQEEVTYRDAQSDSATGAILGGIIGAAVGNELGHRKSNKRVGAVAGAVLGSSIGNDLSRKHHRSYQGFEEKCETYQNYHEEERVDGYLVEYKYRGNVFTTRTQTHPGDYLKVRVNVTPLI